MQATVATYDETSRSGSVFLDDGTRLSFDAAALVDTGLRLLRPGKRVRLDTAPDGGILRVQILTLT
jgi:2-phospho-L-lactate guanylyltransferase